MSMKELLDCPRKSFLHGQIPSGVKKAGQLRKICKDVLLSCDLDTVTESQLNDKVNDAFEAIPINLFQFEAASESTRMKTLLWRYLRFEKAQRHKVLAENFINKVTLFGEDHTISCHRLIDRGASVEAVKYVYKAPDMKYSGRSGNRPEDNPDLCLLQKCGEEELRKRGINKPCFGSFYYMKSQKDTSKQLAVGFEESVGSNIMNYHFEAVDEAELAKRYKGVKANATTAVKDNKKCYDCIFNDLCHTEFVKRSQADMPETEETSLNKISMTPAQRRFVMFDEGQCRVNAVAGSGKTTIVVLRTLRLIEEGCDPSHILMVTFTDKACGEMRSRLRRYAQGSTLKSEDIKVENIEVNTFNGFGQKILEEYYSKLGFTKAPTLVNEVTKKDIVISLLEAHPTLPMDYRNPFLDMRNASGAVIQMTRILDTLKANHVSTAAEVEDLVSNELRGRAAELLDIYNSYNEELVKLNVIDYEDQIRLMLELKSTGVFKDMPYEHVIIDEFQDSDPNQLNLIMEMVKSSSVMKSLVVVGDSMQAIYGFRNATPENLVNIKKFFPEMIDIPMEDNFRSESPIIAMANRILSKEARIATVMRANLAGKTPPVLMKVDNEEKEYDLYLRQIKKLVCSGTAPEDIAILCRTKTELLKVQKVLEDNGIPTVLKVPEVVADAPYVKAVIGLAAFLLDHTDLISLAIYHKSLGLDPFDADAVKKEAEELGQKWDDLSSEKDRLLMFTGLIADAKEDFVAESFIDEVFNSGFHTVKEMLSYCVKYKEYKVKETKSTARENVEAVNLITVHSAKGLEWPIVFLSLRKFQTVSEEENRLLYVAVTRAKEKLLVTYPEKKSYFVTLLT